MQTNYHLRRKQLDTPQMRTRSNGEEIPCHHQANEHDSCSHKSKAELVSKRCPFCFRERRHIFHVRPHAVRPEISDDLCVLRLSTFVRIYCSVTSWFRCHSLQSGAPADNAHALPDHSFMDSTKLQNAPNKNETAHLRSICEKIFPLLRKYLSSFLLAVGEWQ